MEHAPSEFDLDDVTIRLAEDSDCPVVRELFSLGALAGELPENDTGADIENLMDAYFADNGASAFWVATLGDEVIGMIGVQRTRPDTAEMCRLRVRSAFRRRGVGTKLLEQATDFCRRHGYLKVVLDVRVERSGAIALFEKFGFRLTRTREIDGRKLHDFFLDLYSGTQ